MLAVVIEVVEMLLETFALGFSPWILGHLVFCKRNPLDSMCVVVGSQCLAGF